MSATELPPAAAAVPAGLDAVELGAWKGLLRVHASLMKSLDAELEATHRLPLTSYEVLIQLADAPDRKMRMCDLADSVLLSRSGMSRLVDRLERDGLLERAACPNDARGSFAVLTPAGQELLAAARPTHHEGIRRAFLEHFSEDELRQLGAFWTRLLPPSAGS
ncbi:MarR family transcriptional regulator [Conexibacter sp. JD483]|uniref:MarR family winged helix-turn-helix transcriptional regulator n=1 Tax=unclassified Conexibacter TaxID=2627773 RepID=UPI002721E81B|nr:MULTISPECIES: MarR family transcriptional regulator [unclassified Conexibacter]MDO8186635.1 MarR family transcriptional regulator [Conexibacter sp. CPCC 205706]MDO8200355.1 MarR family transcriptional regulator [Conexibacter sp. CPCC 205762]MDR9372440.1 MarR family transcriptional regulator [Conexibacter sp. JD483]